MVRAPGYRLKRSNRLQLFMEVDCPSSGGYLALRGVAQYLARGRSEFWSRGEWNVALKVL